MQPRRFWQILDLVLTAALLLLAALPLIALRNSDVLSSTLFIVCFYPACAALLATWCWLGQRRHLQQATSPPPFPGVIRSTPLAKILTVLALFVVTLAAFGWPMTWHFWGGFDEPVCFRKLPTWDHEEDNLVNRPLIPLPVALADTVLPDRVEGFLAMTVVLWFGIALLLYGILRSAIPQSPGLALSAAILFVVNRSEPSRYFAMWTAIFYTATLFLFLLATWLFLLSYRRGQRSLLALACALLGMALLSNEGVFPLAVLVPVVAWFVRRPRQGLLLWSFAWLGSLGVLAVRLVAFLVTRSENSYQASHTSAILDHPERLWDGLLGHLSTLPNYFQDLGQLDHGKVLRAIIAALVIPLVWRACKASARPLAWKAWLACLGLAGVALVLAVLPFCHMPTLIRTHFFAAPLEALIVSLGIVGLAAFTGRRLAPVLTALAIAFLSTHAAAQSLYEQRTTRPYIYFEKTVHVLHQVHAPGALKPRTLLLLVLDDGIGGPLGPNYAVDELCRNVLGVSGIQVNFRDPNGWDAKFDEEGVSVAAIGPHKYPYSDVVAFRLSADGTAALLLQLPSGLAPNDGQPTGYDPLRRFAPGPLHDLPYLNYTPWSVPLTDVIDPGAGLLLGEGWSPLSASEGRLFRWVHDEAEIIVNPQGLERRSLELEVEIMPPPSRTCRLEVRTQAGQVAASVPVGGRHHVQLSLPLNPSQSNVFRVNCAHEDGTPLLGPPWRVWGPACSDARRLRWLSGPGPAEITGPGLRPGKNWHDLEQDPGKSFRWVANDAEIVNVFPQPAAELLLEVEPGPGLGGQPCQLEIRDNAGHVVGSATVTSRQEVRFKLPRPLSSGAVLQFHCHGGGLTIPSDSRIMNFRVFRCQWITPAAAAGIAAH
jgi:hypothetical protein